MTPARRVCRACGCWELAACEGGCAWATADRCTACPADAPLTLPINAAHVEAATLQRRMAYTWRAVNDEQVERASWQAIEFPNLLVMTTTWSGAVQHREMFVGALQVPDADPAQAADLLNARRLAA